MRAIRFEYFVCGFSAFREEQSAAVIIRANWLEVSLTDKFYCRNSGAAIPSVIAICAQERLRLKYISDGKVCKDLTSACKD